jgi:hypothetical protein
LLLSPVEEDSEDDQSDQQEASDDGKHSHCSVGFAWVVARIGDADWSLLGVAVFSRAAIPRLTLTVDVALGTETSVDANINVVCLPCLVEFLIDCGGVASRQGLIG